MRISRLRLIMGSSSCYIPSTVYIMVATSLLPNLKEKHMITIPTHLELKVIGLAYKAHVTTDAVLENALKLFEDSIAEKPTGVPVVERIVQPSAISDINLQVIKQNDVPDFTAAEPIEKISLKRELSKLYGYSGESHTKTSSLVREACEELGFANVNGVSATAEQKLAILNWHKAKNNLI